MKAFYLLLTLLSFTYSTNAQEQFEGSVTFDFSYEGENLEQYEAFLQTKSVYYIKGKDVRFKMVGGMAAMMGEVLMDGETRSVYQIHDAEKIAYIMEENAEPNDPNQLGENLTITNTNEIETILGYKCLRYNIKDNTDGSTISIWISSELELINPEEFGGSAAGLFFPGVKGVMLKMQASTDLGGGSIMTVTQEVSEILPESLDASLFEIPADYTIKEFDVNEMFKEGGDTDH